MATKTPKKLENDPIIETSFELRFEPADTSSPDLLPGMLLPHLRQYVTGLDSIGPSNIPAEIVAQEPSLWYQPTKRLRGANHTLAIGPRVLALSVNRPYPGWHSFSSAITDVLAALQKTEQVKSVERFSLKYRNLLPVRSESECLSPLNVTFDVAGFDVSQKSIRITCETELDGFQNLINIITRARAQNTQTHESAEGTLIDIDTIFIDGFSDFWSEIKELTEKAHDVEKRVFFKLLTESTTEELKPVWS